MEDDAPEAFGNDAGGGVPIRENRDIRIVAIAGGKGGTGKSLIAANVAIFLATLDKRVLLVDADLGNANLHDMVGVQKPRGSLADLIERRVEHVDELANETPITGLKLIAGEAAPWWLANPSSAQKFRLFNQLQKSTADWMVLDLPSGSAFNALEFFLLADQRVLVVDPEPTSVENMYRFLKAAFTRRLKFEGLSAFVARDCPSEVLSAGGILAPLDLLRRAQQTKPELIAILTEEMKKFRTRLIVNKVRARADADLGATLVTAARRHLGLAVDYLGHLEHDDAAWVAVRKRRPLLLDQPDSRIARGIERITRRLLALEGERTAPAEMLDRQDNYYELLEVEASASEEDLRRAFRRVREIYGANSIAVAGLYDAERLEGLHKEFQNAYDTLMDSERRRGYDLETFPTGLPQRQRASTPVDDSLPAPRSAYADSSPPAHSDPLPPAPVITAETEFTGSILRQVRKARGVDLRAVAEKTKIGIGHLHAIEDERFDLLPAPVYVRGFLTEFGKVLGLDVRRLLDTYLERFKQARIEMDDG